MAGKQIVYLIEEVAHHGSTPEAIKCLAGMEARALIREHGLSDPSHVCDFLEEGDSDSEDGEEYTRWNVSQDEGETWTRTFRAYGEAEGQKEISRLAAQSGVVTNDCTDLEPEHGGRSVRAQPAPRL